MCLEEDINESGSCLYDGDVEKKDWANKRDMQVVIDTAKTVLRFIYDILDDSIVYILLE